MIDSELVALWEGSQADRMKALRELHQTKRMSVAEAIKHMDSLVKEHAQPEPTATRASPEDSAAMDLALAEVMAFDEHTRGLVLYMRDARVLRLVQPTGNEIESVKKLLQTIFTSMSGLIVAGYNPTPLMRCYLRQMRQATLSKETGEIVNPSPDTTAQQDIDFAAACKKAHLADDILKLL